MENNQPKLYNEILDMLLQINVKSSSVVYGSAKNSQRNAGADAITLRFVALPLKALIQTLWW